MTLPARARKLTIGDESYRWLVSTREAPESQSIWIQHESGAGARVEALVNRVFAVSSKWRFSQASMATPALVRRAVTAALEEGWDPHRPGPARRVHLPIDALVAPRWFQNPEPLLVPFENHSSPRVQSLSTAAFPRARHVEVVIECDGVGQGKGLFVIVLRDNVLGRLWADVLREDEFLHDVLSPDRDLPLRTGTLQAPHHEIEQGGEILCWSAGDDVFFAARTDEHFDQAPTHQRAFTTWYKVNRAELAAAFCAVVVKLRRHLPESSSRSRDPA